MLFNIFFVVIAKFDIFLRKTLEANLHTYMSNVSHFQISQFTRIKFSALLWRLISNIYTFLNNIIISFITKYVCRKIGLCMHGKEMFMYVYEGGVCASTFHWKLSCNVFNHFWGFLIYLQETREINLSFVPNFACIVGSFKS